MTNANADQLGALQKCFPDSESVFTLCEIAQALSVSYDAVRRAQVALRYRPSTQKLVTPLDDVEPQHFSPLAARLIARHVLRPLVSQLRQQKKIALQG